MVEWLSSQLVKLKRVRRERTVPSRPSRVPSRRYLPAGIDIGTSGIKLVQLAQGPGRELEITKLDMVQYREVDQRLEPNAQKIELLRMLVERNKIGPEVVTSFSIKELQFYNLRLPPMSRQELQEAVRWKIEQLLPAHMQMKDVEFDFLILDEEESLRAKAQVKILAVVAPRAAIQERLELLREMGLEPVAIEVEPFALTSLASFRVSGLGKPHPDKSGRGKEVVLWLDLGAEATSITVTRGTKVYFCRSLAVNSNRLTRAVLEHRHLSWDKAEDLKVKYGLSGWSPGQPVPALLEKEGPPPKDESTLVYLAMASTLENLMVDIEHSFKYFSYQITQTQITEFERITLAGGGANLKGLPQFLSEKLGVPVELLNPFSGFKISGEVRSQRGRFLEAPSEFAVACGLAVREVDKRGIRPNLMPKKIAKRPGFFLSQRVWQEKGMRVGVGVACAFLVILGLSLGQAGRYRWRVNSARREVQLVKSELKRLQSQQFELAKEEAEFLDRKLKREARLNLLKESRRYPKEFSNVLAEIATLVPEGIWVRELSYSDRKLSITGSTSNTQLVVGLIEKLEASETVINPTFNHTQKEPKEEGVYSFEVIAEIKP